MSLVASLGGVFAAFRFIWSFLLDKYSYKKIYGALIVLQLLVALSLPSILQCKDGKFKNTLFLLSVCFGFFCEGGHFVLAPTIFAKLFGAQGGIRVYSVGFSFIGVASIVNVFMMDYVLDIIGFGGFCYAYSALSFVALLILVFAFEEKKAFAPSMPQKERRAEFGAS